MWPQIKYSAINLFHKRKIVLAVAVAINLFFVLMAAALNWGLGGTVTGVVLSSFALCGLFVGIVISDYDSVKSLFSAPGGYQTFLTPVPRWKILLARVATIVVFDAITLVLGISGVVIQSLILAGQYPTFRNSGQSDLKIAFFFALLGLFFYILVVELCFFIPALCKSVFYRTPAKGLLGTLVALVAFYLYDIAFLILGLVEPVMRYGLLFTVTVRPGFNAGTFLLLGVSVLEALALFAGTVYLMERKINI